MLTVILPRGEGHNHVPWRKQTCHDAIILGGVGNCDRTWPGPTWDIVWCLLSSYPPPMYRHTGSRDWTKPADRWKPWGGKLFCPVSWFIISSPHKHLPAGLPDHDKFIIPSRSKETTTIRPPYTIYAGWKRSNLQPKGNTQNGWEFDKKTMIFHSKPVPDSVQHTQMIVHLAQHLGNFFVFLFFFVSNWCHVPNHYFSWLVALWWRGKKRLESQETSGSTNEVWNALHVLLQLSPCLCWHFRFKISNQNPLQIVFSLTLTSSGKTGPIRMNVDGKYRFPWKTCWWMAVRCPNARIARTRCHESMNFGIFSTKSHSIFTIFSHNQEGVTTYLQFISQRKTISCFLVLNQNKFEVRKDKQIYLEIMTSYRHLYSN